MVNRKGGLTIQVFPLTTSVSVLQRAKTGGDQACSAGNSWRPLSFESLAKIRKFSATGQTSFALLPCCNPYAASLAPSGATESALCVAMDVLKKTDAAPCSHQGGYPGATVPRLQSSSLQEPDHSLQE